MTTLILPRITIHTLRLHPLAIIVALGLALRLLLIGNAPLWYDEGGSVWMATLPFDRMLAATAGDTHPPLYLALLWIWVRVAGTSEAAVRLPSALFSLLCIPLTYLIAQRLNFSRTVALVAAALMAIIPPQIHYAQEARMYSLLCLEFALGLLAALDRRPWLLAIALALMFWTHNYGLLYAVPLNVLAIAQLIRPGREWRHIFTEILFLAWWNTLALLAWFPWMFVLINQMRDVAGGYWIPPATPGALLYMLYMVSWGLTQRTSLQDHQALLLFGALGFAAWRARAHSGARWCVALVVVALAVPTAISIIWQPILLFRALMPLSLPLCLLFAWAFTDGLSSRRRLLLALLALPIVAAGAALYYIRIPEAKGDTIVLRYIQFKPGDILYHINDGSMVVSHAYTPFDWRQYEMPQAWTNIGDLSPSTRAALGIQLAPLEAIEWRRAWVIHGATPMTALAEDQAVAALLETYPHQVIYLDETPATRLAIYLIWNLGVGVQ